MPDLRHYLKLVFVLAICLTRWKYRKTSCQLGEISHNYLMWRANVFILFWNRQVLFSLSLLYSLQMSLKIYHSAFSTQSFNNPLFITVFFCSFFLNAREYKKHTHRKIHMVSFGLVLRFFFLILFDVFLPFVSVKPLGLYVLYAWKIALCLSNVTNYCKYVFF